MAAKNAGCVDKVPNTAWSNPNIMKPIPQDKRYARRRLLPRRDVAPRTLKWYMVENQRGDAGAEGGCVGD